MVTQKTVEEIEAERVKDACGFTIEHEEKNRLPLECRLVETWREPGEWRRGVCKICRKEYVPEPPQSLSETKVPPSTACDSPECRRLLTEYNIKTIYGANRGGTPIYDRDCPVVYKDIISSGELPPTVDRDAFDKVMLWTPDKKPSLLCLGASGAGKTLALWAKGRKLEADGRRIRFLTSVELMRTLAKAARDIERAEPIMRIPVLIVDDLGKERVTDAAASALWELIESRNNNRLVTIYSTRFRGADFTARFADKIMGDDIRGRVADSSRRIEFLGRIPLPNAA